MATPPEQPWSPYEKNYMLAEIIKAAHPPPEALFSIVRNHNIQPRWEDIALPPGRSLNSSRFAFEELRRTLSAQPIGGAMGPNTPLSAPINLKRSYQFEGPYSAGGTGREIRPKPSSFGPAYAPSSHTDPPPKRKRGRPTKAETQAKAEAEAAALAARAVSGEARHALAQSPLSRAPVQAPLLMPAQRSASTDTRDEGKPLLPPTTRMPIAAMLTPTTREESKSLSHSGSSSGKRRRARSTKSEMEDGSPTTRHGAEYESPYARVRGAPEDSPARAAVLRHREGFEQSTNIPPLSSSGISGSEPQGSEPNPPTTVPQ